MKASMVKESSQPKTSSNNTIKKLMVLGAAMVIFLALFLFLPEAFPYAARVMTAIVSFGIILWAFEPIPLGLTAFILLLLMLLFNVADHDIVFSGFASPAIFLIVAGMMLAEAVNATSLIKRLTYMILMRFGRTSKGLLGSIIAILQIQSIFIPATAVRTTLMIPVASMIIKTVGAKHGSPFQKMLMLGVAFGATMSGTAVMTAAIGNILTVDILNRFADVNITYFEWFLYTFPIWLLITPAIWILLIKMFPLPSEHQTFPTIQREMKQMLNRLGPMDQREKRCIIILIFIVGLWLAEPLHGLHPSIPAMIGVVLLTFPSIGCSKWEDVVKINYNTILLLSITLSIGYAFVDTGAPQIISQYLSVDWVLKAVQIPVLAMTLMIILTQVFHKFIANVSTAVVTLVPIVLSIAANAGVDPLIMVLSTSLTCLYGFVLVVETMPNLIVHSSGMIEQRDFLKPGLYATILTTILTIIIASVWWKVLGLY